MILDSWLEQIPGAALRVRGRGNLRTCISNELLVTLRSPVLTALSRAQDSSLLGTG